MVLRQYWIQPHQCTVVIIALNGLNPKSLILISLPYVFKVLILEPTKIYQPSYLSINNEVEEKTISIWHVLPDDKVSVQLTRVLIVKDFIPSWPFIVWQIPALIRRNSLLCVYLSYKIC